METNRFYIDFSDRDNLNQEDKEALKALQESLRPIERIQYLLDFVISGKISIEDWEVLTGIPWNYNEDII